MSSIRWLLAIVVLAGMLLAAGLTEATASPNYALLPKAAVSANFVVARIASEPIVNVALEPHCSNYSEYGDSGCSEYPEPPEYTYIPPPPHRPRRIPPITPPRICQETVPNLINRTEDQARGALAAVGLGVGSDQPGNNRVVSQVPVAGTRVLCGWVVTVTVDQPPLPPPPPPPPPPSVEFAPADPPPAVVVPSLSPVMPAAVPVSRLEPIPWFWPVVIALLLLCAALLVGLLLLLAARSRKGPKWVRAHVRAVAGAAHGAGVEVTESRTDHSVPLCVVRLESHADSGSQVLEEVCR
jgi:hypothetical protein